MTKEEQNQAEADCLRCYEQGYEKGKNDTIEKTCEWLREQETFNYPDMRHLVKMFSEEDIENFIKEMEEKI